MRRLPEYLVMLTLLACGSPGRVVGADCSADTDCKEYLECLPVGPADCTSQQSHQCMRVCDIDADCTVVHPESGCAEPVCSGSEVVRVCQVR